MTPTVNGKTAASKTNTMNQLSTTGDTVMALYGLLDEIDQLIFFKKNPNVRSVGW